MSKRKKRRTRRITKSRVGERPKTILAKTLSKEEKKQSALLDDYMHEDMPKTRAECKYGYRPCPYVRCKYNLYLHVKNNGSIVQNWKANVCDMTESCALDISERGGHTLDQIGEFLNLTRERIRQLEASALKKLKENNPKFAEYLEGVGNSEQSMNALMDHIKYNS
ncbi:MAG: sigma factor-like helix-turn-helix DNA-binding protein [Myxococcota bacterium]